jgi:hypothetical protein
MGNWWFLLCAVGDRHVRKVLVGSLLGFHQEQFWQVLGWDGRMKVVVTIMRRRGLMV